MERTHSLPREVSIFKMNLSVNTAPSPVPPTMHSTPPSLNLVHPTPPPFIHPIYNATMITPSILSGLNDSDQQIRFNKYLQRMVKKQENLKHRFPLVVYEVHPESGIGNMIRGYITGLIIAALSKRILMSTYLSWF